MGKERHTLNNLRKELKAMTTEQKKEKLKELQANLMIEWGREKSNAMGMPGPKSGPHTTWIIRKCIAMVKTSLHMKGFSYNQR